MADESRTIALVRSKDAFGIAVFRITDKRHTTFYVLREIPCFIGGRGFEVHRLGLGELYHVRVGRRDDCSCECLGFLRHNRCRHILGLMALIRANQL
jgi:hypothetical protein